MRTQFFQISAVFMLAACSSPKYTYNFDRYDYNSGRKPRVEKPLPKIMPIVEVSPLIFSENDFLASTSSGAWVSTELKNSPASTLKGKAGRYKTMSARERKDFRKEVRQQINNYTKQLKSGDQVAGIDATKELDDELKLAIIFGAIGITLTVLGGINTVFWVLGVVGLAIGLVFFIRWISRQ